MRAVHLLLLGLCLVLFTASATTDLALPGPQADESAHACLAIDLMRPPHPYSRDYTLRIGSQPFPFGVDAHTGGVKSYSLWPLFALLGPSVGVMRFFTITLGILILVFFYLFIRDTVGSWPAFWGTLFLSLHTPFIFYSKLEGGHVIDTVLWMMLTLWSLTKWEKTLKIRFLLLGLFSSLLGIYSHATFIWFLGGGTLAAFLFCKETLVRLLKRPFIYFWVPGVSLILTIFLYWLAGETGLLSTSMPGMRGGFVMFERLTTLGGILPDILFGHLTDKRLPLPGIQARPLTDFFLGTSVLFLLSRYRQQPRAIRPLLVLSGAMFVWILLTPGNFVQYPHRMLPALLFLFLFAGTAFSQSLFLLREGKAAGGRAVALGIVLLAALSVWGQLDLKYQADRRIRETGGKGRWSDGIYALSEWIERDDWDKVVCLRWGLVQPLFLLTEGKRPLETPHWKSRTSEKRQKEALYRFLRESSPRTLFLLNPEKRWEGEIALRTFFETVEEKDKMARLQYIIRDREGDPLYMAYTVHDPP